MAINVSPAKRGAFLKLLRIGMSINRSARSAGFNPKTYFDWQNRAKEDPERYQEEAEFMAACGKAEADGVAILFGLAHKHAKKDPATVRYLLGLKGHVVKKEVEYSGAIAVKRLTDDETLAELGELLGRHETLDPDADAG